MKIKSKKLIELLKTDDTDNLYTFRLEITSDVLNDPEALDEFIELFKKETKVTGLTVIVKEDDLELGQKIAKAIPKKIQDLDIRIECENVDTLDLSSKEFSNVKVLRLNTDSFGNYSKSINNLILPPRLKGLHIRDFKTISHIEASDEIKEQLVVDIENNSNDLCKIDMPKVETIVISALEFIIGSKSQHAIDELKKLKQILELYPDVKYFCSSVSSQDKSSITGVKENLDDIIQLLEKGRVNCTQEHFEELLLFVEKISGVYSRNFSVYNICDGQELIDIRRVPTYSKESFDFSSIGDEKCATIVIKDATELSTLEAKALEEEAKKHGIKLFIKMNDKHLGENQKVPYSISDYIECSIALDEIIEETQKALPEKASEEDKFAKLIEVLASKLEYDDKMAKENDLKVTRSVSSRNLLCLRNRKGVCAGLAEVVRNASRRIGLECEYDAGDKIELVNSVGFHQDLIDRTSFGKDVVKTSHAWNRIKIDGNWYISDTTGNILNLRKKSVPRYFLLSDTLARKIGYKSKCNDQPKCETEYPKEKVAKLFENYYSADFFMSSTAQLYGVTKRLEKYTKYPFDNKDFVMGNPFTAFGRNLLTFTRRTSIAAKSFREKNYTFSEIIGIVKKGISDRIARITKNKLFAQKDKKMLNEAQSDIKPTGNNSNPNKDTRTKFEKEHIGTLVGKTGKLGKPRATSPDNSGKKSIKEHNPIREDKTPD